MIRVANYRMVIPNHVAGRTQVRNTRLRRRAFARARYHWQGELLMRCGNVNDDAVDYFDLKCAWCKQVIGGSNVKDSHGMCEACYLRQLQIRRAPGERPAHPTHGDGIEPAQE